MRRSDDLGSQEYQIEKKRMSIRTEIIEIFDMLKWYSDASPLPQQYKPL